MPVVVLLSLVGGLVVSVALARSAQRYTIVREQLADYRDTHRAFGIKKITANWLEYSATQDIDAMTGGTGSGGRAFTISLPGGAGITASFFPAQETMLVEPLGLSAREARIVRNAADRLEASVVPARLGAMTRRIGPIGVDLARADASIIRAIAEAAFSDADDDGESLGTELAATLIAERASGKVDRPGMVAICERLGIDGKDRELVMALFALDPYLWRVRVEYREPLDPAGPSGRIEEYEGMIELPGGSLASGAGRHANELFLSWDRVESTPGYTRAVGE